MTGKGNARNLNSICNQIKALEKNSVANAIKIGNLLEQAFEECEYGQWCEWLKDNFGWSLTTARRYRDVYTLSKNRQIGDFDRMDFSLSAIYLAADLGPDDPRTLALVEAALKGRVTHAVAIDILEKLKPQRAPPPPPPPPIKPPPDQDERGESGDAPPPPPDDIEEDTASESVKLLLRLNGLLRDQESDWAKAIEAVGSVRVREILNDLSRKLDRYHAGKAIKAKADAAEATASRGKTPV